MYIYREREDVKTPPTLVCYVTYWTKLSSLRERGCIVFVDEFLCESEVFHVWIQQFKHVCVCVWCVVCGLLYVMICLLCHMEAVYVFGQLCT